MKNFGAKMLLELRLPSPWTIFASIHAADKALQKFFEEDDNIECQGTDAIEFYKTLRKEYHKKGFLNDMNKKAVEVNKDKSSRRKEVFDLMDLIEEKFLKELQKHGNKVDLAEFQRKMMEKSDLMFAASVKVHKRLKEDHNNYKEIVPPVLDKEAPSVTLKKYVEDNSIDKSQIECARIVNQAHHGRILRAVYRLFLDSSVKDKRHVCWLYGQPNSGKSRFIEAIHKIFSSEEISWHNKFMPVKQRNRSDLQV